MASAMGSPPDPDNPDLLMGLGSIQKRRGRPKAPDPGSPVTTWMTPQQHAQLVTFAQQHQQSISGVVRVAVTRYLERWQQKQSKARGFSINSPTNT